MKYFIHYWKNETWEKNRRLSNADWLLSHISGSQFFAREIESGDIGYVVTLKNGSLYLCGKMEVGAACTLSEAADATGMTEEDLYDAPEHLIASSGTVMQWDRTVPVSIVRGLRLWKEGQFGSPDLDRNGLLDRQTFRSVRLMSKESAQLLDTLLEELEPLDAFEDMFPSLWELTDLGDEGGETENESGVEGNKKQRFISYYERLKKYRDAALRIHGYACQACGLSFEEMYGPYGKGFIHVHHTVPVSQYENARRIDPKTEMAVLCPNCHAMIHKERKRTLSVEQVKKLIADAKRGL